MKILIIQEYSRHPENVLFRECLCYQRAFKSIGWDADVWGLGHSNFTSLPDFNGYDVIFNCENYGDEWLPDLKQYTRPFKILYAIDPHCRGLGPYNHIVDSQGYNFMFVAVRNFAAGRNKAWLPSAADEELFYNKNLVRDIPLGFVGNYVNRKELLDHLTEHCQLQQFIKVFGDDMVNLINRFQISFNKNISIDTNYRTFETIACNTMLLADNNPAYKDLGFISGTNCYLYNSTDEIKDFIEMSKKTPEVVTKIAANGYELSKKHTFKKRAQSIASFLKDKL
jgi:hypothetical protein